MMRAPTGISYISYRLASVTSVTRGDEGADWHGHAALASNKAQVSPGGVGSRDGSVSRVWGSGFRV